VHQAADLSNKIKHFFTFERIFLLIFLAAFVLRFWQLDLKLFHHDEAIHSWFSYELMTNGTWVYDPSYHGPFLYYVTAGMFSVFGDSDLVARILPSLFGLLLIPLVYCIYRLGYLDKKQTLFAALFIAISPDMVYFSRFLRHDIFMLFFTFLLLVAILYYFERGQTRYVILGAIATGGALACKEEMPVILLIFISFFAFALWRKRFTLPEGWKYDIAIGVIITLGILVALYSSFGFHPETILGQNFQISLQGVNFQTSTTGWYRAVEHWVGMHNEQRLGGPYYFYLPLYLLYELPIFILATIGTLQFLAKDVDAFLFLKKAKNWFSSRRFEIPVHDLANASLRQLRTRKEGSGKSDIFFQFCIYWMILTMAFYAYVGEKVPWLLIHQLLPMCFVAVYKLNWQKMAIAILGCVFLIVMTWHVAFIPADINEPIVQVQNSEDLRQVMKLMDKADLVAIASPDYWPLPWYYRGEKWKKVKFYDNRTDIDILTQKNPEVIILHDTESYPSIAGYDKKTYKLSYWFSFYDNENRLPDYYLHRDGKMGSINIDVFTPLPDNTLPAGNRTAV
jgi:uncharacterized protein (TIGR03663 family)